MPVSTGPAIAGSTQRNCSACSEPIWVSPATLQSVASFPDRQFVCIQCAMKLDDFEEALQAPTPEQMEELRGHLSPEQLSLDPKAAADPDHLLSEMKKLFRPLALPEGDTPRPKYLKNLPPGWDQPPPEVDT
jgi:hypothetical protein